MASRRALGAMAAALAALVATAAAAEPRPRAARASAAPPSAAAQFIAGMQSDRADVPRVELAARLIASGFADTAEFKAMRENAAREISGRPDGQGAVAAAELERADHEIRKASERLQAGEAAAPPSLAELARQSGRPQLPGLAVVYLHPLGRPEGANTWRHIIVHQTEGPAGSARSLALAQFRNPTRRGVTVWVETDGTLYWSTAENAIPTHGDGANRNDNKYIDNTRTYRSVVRTNSIGVEFVGNYPDVAAPATPAQAAAWLILVRFLQERYAIAPEHVYAHNWIDYKDRRYCEGCELATLARRLDYRPRRP
jgi:hypothetical protein